MRTGYKFSLKVNFRSFSINAAFDLIAICNVLQRTKRRILKCCSDKIKCVVLFRYAICLGDNKQTIEKVQDIKSKDGLPVYACNSSEMRNCWV